MRSKTFTVTALMGTLIIGTSATAVLAQEGPRGARAPEVMFVQMLQKHDANKDGKISKEESAAAVDLMFVEVDTDADGLLTPGEFRTHREKMKTERQAAAAEMREQRASGAADGEQAAKPGKRGDERHAGRHGGDRDGKGMRAERGGSDGKRGGPRGMMRTADTDENGQISKVEAVAMADKMFERMDRDTDGFITVEDMPKRWSMMR